MQTSNNKPVIALTLGDANGIGAELIARLLNRVGQNSDANIVLIADPWLWEEGQKVAEVQVTTVPVSSFAEVRNRENQQVPALLSRNTMQPNQQKYAEVQADAGTSSLQMLNECMDAALAGHVDAITFAPLNKHALKMGGMKHEDELHHFATYLGVQGYFCEFNTLNGLWTSRISSHIPFKDISTYVNKERIIEATKLVYNSLKLAGNDKPRVAVAGLNPHNGEGGTCGREEIDIIQPTVAELNANGIPVEGPYSADTIFLRAQNGELDAIVTMYHDQGQIAIKLMGFSKGVTVQGGLPIPITTPAHGTAYDIAGQGKANEEATWQAFQIACRMGASHRATTQ